MVKKTSLLILPLLALSFVFYLSMARSAKVDAPRVPAPKAPLPKWKR